MEVVEVVVYQLVEQVRERSLQCQALQAPREVTGRPPPPLQHRRLHPEQLQHTQQLQLLLAAHSQLNSASVQKGTAREHW